MSFRIGQRVVCVNDRFKNYRRSPSDRSLRSGCVYTIAWVGVDACAMFPTPTLSVHLEEITREVSDLDGRRLPYFASRFRPVKETNIDVFTAMLAPTPKQRQRVTTSDHQSDEC
jgi:hypothetical protein